MQFNNPTSTKNENKQYDNSTLKKINRRRPVARVQQSGYRFPSHPARARLLCAFAASASDLSSRLLEPPNTVLGDDALISNTTGSFNAASVKCA